MIQQKTILKVFDNSGAKTVRCIKVLGGFKKKYASLGDTIVVSVQTLRNKSKKTSKVKKKDGSTIIFNENSVALMNKQGNPIGTRIIGPLPKLLLKKKKIQKFLSISTGLI